MPKPTAPDDDKATGNAGDAPAWLSVSRASQIAGVSKRAMQKRAAAGTIGARKVGDGSAARWEIDGRELSANLTANSGANREPVGREPRTINREQFAPLDAVKRESGREPRTDDREPGENQTANREPTGRELWRKIEAELRTQLAREREFSNVLKSQLEAVTQSEAQTKAALREALRAMPKQLGAGDAPPVQQPAPTAPPQREQSGAAVNDGAANVESATRAPGAQQSGGYDYGALADELERNLNQ